MDEREDGRIISAMRRIYTKLGQAGDWTEREQKIIMSR